MWFACVAGQGKVCLFAACSVRYVVVGGGSDGGDDGGGSGLFFLNALV